MTEASYSGKATDYLHTLCLDIAGRSVGSAGNRAATDFFARTVASFGFRVETPAFDCMDWTSEGAHLSADGAVFEAHVSPYSLGRRVRAPLAAVSTVEALAAADVTGKVLLVQGDLTAEPLMPKNFPFYNPEEHQRIISLLEAKQPAAIVAATARNPMAGAVYPFPFIEDGDFDIPSVYMTDEAGSRLAAHVGREVSLEIRAERRPATGYNVVATKGGAGGRRLVICAHIDAKAGTPGALDNAAGVTVLLLLAEQLAGYGGELGIEIVALNGEDYYSSPGEQLYLAMNSARFEEIVLGINLDGLGYQQGATAYSLYECPPNIAAVIHGTFSAHAGLVEGEPWYQGDHGLFIMQGRPALAMTSERAWEVLTEVAHTPQDRPERVDTGKLVEAASALAELVPGLKQTF